jgi:GAF domain-containing protein
VRVTASAGWLELLLADAPPEALEAHRQELLAAGADPAVVDADARQALQLQAQLRDRSQRASELTVLSEIASRLASVRDLAALLNDIAVQARALLRTDLSYLALVEDDAMRIRYFDGTLGPSSREIRMSMTAGLAGRIVTTGQPGWTSDYLADASIEHLEDADRFAQDERLHSLLGVPIRAAGSTLGVLFAAERSSRAFGESEISLLTGLAGHAAVAIENARLFDAERSASDELRAVNEQLQASASAVDRAIALHERLTDAVVRGGGPAEVVQALADVLKAPVQLVDAADRPLAGPELGAPSPAELFASQGPATVVLPGEDDTILVLCPVIAAEDYLGSLVVRGHGSADDAEVRLLERGALGIALSLVQERALVDAATRSRGELLTALVEGGEPEVLDRRAAAARIDLSREHVLAVVDVQDAPGRSACAEVARRSDGLVVDRAGKTLLLVPAGTDLSPLVAHATAGVSAPVRGAAALPEAYTAARQCLTAVLALGKRQIVASAEDLGVYRFLLAAGGQDGATEFIARTVGPLLRHDEAKGTDLARTLEEYLASGRQHTATAERLHIHPNTLYQRLTRIGAVLGEGWREADQALDLHVALRLHRLAGQL